MRRRERSLLIAILGLALARGAGARTERPLTTAAPAGAATEVPGATARGPSNDGPPADTLRRALSDELARSMSRLALAGMPRPYYLAYMVVDHDQVTVSADLGALVRADRQRARLLRVVVRVGSPELDNTNSFGDFRSFAEPVRLPVDEDYGAIRHVVWLATDEAYKDAVEALEKKRAALSTQSTLDEDVADFSPAEVTRAVARAEPRPADEAALATLVRDASAVYREVPEVQSGKAAVVVSRSRKLLVSSDGALVDEPRTVVRFDAVARGQAADGMELERLVSYTVARPEALPATSTVARAVRQSALDLARARTAQAVEDYAGPVLFEPRAAAQLLRAIAAEQFSGAPAPRGGDPRLVEALGELESDLVGRIGQRVLPAGFTVVDDPGREDLAGQLLIGAMRADDEGVPAKAVRLVEDGMLRTLLMSRAPRKELAGSNGHGRAGLAGGIRARPASLVFATSRGIGRAALVRRLLSEVKAAGLSYGIIVRALDEPTLVGGGRRSWMRDGDLPDPVELVRVGLDGVERPLRGGTLGGLRLRTLKTIVAAGATPAVVSYFAAGASALHATPLGGPQMTLWGLPTSIAAPALLFPDIDVRRVKGPQSRPPVLSRPTP